MQVPFGAALLLEQGVQSPSVEGDFLSHRSLQRDVEVLYSMWFIAFIAREHACSLNLWKYWLLVLFISTELKLQRQQEPSTLFLSNCPNEVSACALMYCFPLTAWGVVNARLGCFKGAVESNSSSNNCLVARAAFQEVLIWTPSAGNGHWSHTFFGLHEQFLVKILLLAHEMTKGERSKTAFEETRKCPVRCLHPNTVWGCRLGQSISARVWVPVVVTSHLPMAEDSQGLGPSGLEKLFEKCKIK